MSASNWDICPLCSRYLPDGLEEYTFREDYEIYGAETGTITVSYSGHCRDCGSGVDFKYQVPIKIKEAK